MYACMKNVYSPLWTSPLPSWHWTSLLRRRRVTASIIITCCLLAGLLGQAWANPTQTSTSSAVRLALQCPGTSHAKNNSYSSCTSQPSQVVCIWVLWFVWEVGNSFLELLRRKRMREGDWYLLPFPQTTALTFFRASSCWGLRSPQ